MLTFPASVKVYLCLPPVDMRLSFDRLAALASEVMRENPLSGHFFVFHSRRNDRIKILYWDRDGLAIWHKRLEKGTFPFPAADASLSLAVSPAELAFLLEGVSLEAARTLRKAKRFALPERSGKNNKKS